MLLRKRVMCEIKGVTRPVKMGTAPTPVINRPARGQMRGGEGTGPRFCARPGVPGTARQVPVPPVTTGCNTCHTFCDTMRWPSAVG